MSVWSFFYVHYWADEKKDADYLADMQLPFKTHNTNIASHIASINFIPQSNTIVLKPAEDAGTKFQMYKQPFLTSSYRSNIWQPPKASSYLV